MQSNLHHHQFKTNKEVALAAVQQDGYALRYVSPILQNDKQVVMVAIKKWAGSIQFASSSLRNDKDVAMAAVKEDLVGTMISLSSTMRNDDEVAQTVVQKKYIIAEYLKRKPDAIRYVPDILKRDTDILIAAGMFDVDHDDYTVERRRQRQQQQQQQQQHHQHHQLPPTRKWTSSIKKIVLSTRFALATSRHSQATKFTKLFKESQYIREGNFVVYSPNAFDKQTCNENWTDFDWPCRGTKETCQYNNILSDDGRPTDDCCWRYSFRSQLQEAKDTGGFMLQLVETEDGQRNQNPTLGKGQKIEMDITQTLGAEIFQVYRPTYQQDKGFEYNFSNYHTDILVAEIIAGWYSNQCQDMSVTVVHPKIEIRRKKLMSNKDLGLPVTDGFLL